ncbi:hypothetical protein BCV73_24230 [Paenibacillus sp. SSG-1]|uniref:hypothetical protein n=1 Tax=Paenibacillus sp. SSG-1 TaxID=1443669 RepID=UPI000B7D5BC7|nr:hypothetical protein [Paenibacillus sp. SSG-1]OXL85836.1 hypothetical protein BCV73_24230 [Paenibacillus sp. SSG-1]
MKKPHYDITRYLCAAAEISSKFRTKVFEQIIDNTIRYIAPSYGVDVPLVARHCLRAHMRDFIVETLLSLVLFGALFSSFNSYGVVLGILHFVMIIFTYPWLISIFLRWANLYVGYRIVAKDLKINDAQSEKKSWIELKYEKRIQDLEKIQDGNVVYYSGYNPFVGSGNKVDSWSFVCSIERKEGEVTDQVSLYTLYDLIRRNMESLVIPNLTVKDMLYVNGREIRDDGRFLFDPYHAPLSVVSDAVIDQYKEIQEENIRYYQSVQVVGWQGNLVFSSFFRVSKNDKHLFVEANYYALPPLKSEYYEIDKFSSSIPFGRVLKMGISSILPALYYLPLSPYRAVRSGMAFFAGWKDKRNFAKQVDDTHKFDYGAFESIREMAANEKMQNYFQKTDSDMYKKQIERCYTDSIVEYLESIGVDVSEFVQRKETVINKGVMINGGEFNGDVVSVGDQTNKFIRQVKNAFQSS